MRCVDQVDLACRESAEIKDCYLAAWFSWSQNGERCFSPPAFYLKNARAFFINGRHRALLLSRHLRVLPMALTQVDVFSQDALECIVDREIELNEILVLPDLPIQDSL
jgi:hypothetical protein